jgi:hypothetical protein
VGRAELGAFLKARPRFASKKVALVEALSILAAIAMLICTGALLALHAATPVPFPAYRH